MLKRRTTLWFSTWALLLGLVAGCASFEVPKTLALPGSEDKPQRPSRMTALWSDTVLVEAGVAGFGGRVMFYGRGDEDPIMVDGELTVFAYDDTEDVRDDSVPARKFVFRAEEFSKHYSKSSLGHSYSFWIPWGRVGGPPRQVSLIARLKSAKGGVVMSEMTRHLLPGVKTPVASAPKKPSPVAIPQSGVATVAYHEAVAAPDGGDGMSTTTITLPEALGAAVRNGALADPAIARSGVPVRVDAAPLGANAATAVTTRDENATGSSPAEIRAMVRDAVREALESNRRTQPADRFGHPRRRARIEPKLRPTRDPAPTQLRPATPQSDLPGTLQAAAPIGSATSASAPLPTTPSGSTRGR